MDWTGLWIKEKQYDMKSKSIILGADAYYATHPASLPSSCSPEEALGRAGDKASFEMMMMAMMIYIKTSEGGRGGEGSGRELTRPV